MHWIINSIFTLQILMQLTAENAPKPVKQVSSEYASDIPSQDASFNGESGEFVPEGGVSAEQEELSSLFSGMAVSGEKSPRPARPTQPVQPVRQVKPSPPTLRSKKQLPEESSAFGDLLGLVRPHTLLDVALMSTVWLL